MNPRADSVDGVLRRSAARTPDHTPLTFLAPTWAYPELDDALPLISGALPAIGGRISGPGCALV